MKRKLLHDREDRDVSGSPFRFAFVKPSAMTGPNRYCGGPKRRLGLHEGLSLWDVVRGGATTKAHSALRCGCAVGAGKQVACDYSGCPITSD